MTYCVALRLDSGMIFASDSRTNAGVDHIATFCKMRVYEKPDDRVIVVLSSGNLAMTQGVTTSLDRHKLAAEGEPTINGLSPPLPAEATVSTPTFAAFSTACDRSSSYAWPYGWPSDILTISR